MAISRRRIFENMALAGMAATAAQAAQEKTRSGRRRSRRRAAAELQIRSGSADALDRRRRLCQGGDSRRVSHFAEHRGRFNAAQARRHARIALAFAGGGVGLHAGRALRVTVINPEGQAEVADFEVGDTWYFPRGHGHSLQGLGPGECHFLLGFDNGHFSEFGTFSVTDWIATTPPNIVARNLNLSAAEVARFPRKEVYIGTGRVPPATPARLPQRRFTACAVLAQVPAARPTADKVRRRDGARSLVTRVSDSDHPDCGAARSRTGRVARNALAPARR